MSAGELVLLFAVTLGGVACVGMLIAVLLLWFRHAIKQVALLLAGVGAFVLLMTLITQLSPDALAMAVGIAFGLLAMVPVVGLLRAANDPHSRAHACEPWTDDAYYFEDTRPAAYLDADDVNVVTVERINHKQLTGGHNERR